jgi:hypothetical protein
MMKITALFGLVALCAGQDLTKFYDGWSHAVGLKSSFTDSITKVFEKAKEDMHFMDLQKPMSLLETGAAQGVESMSEGTAMKLINFLKPIQEAVEALEFEAAAARGEYGFRMGVMVCHALIALRARLSGKLW